jgi:HEAT repeat protein
LLPLRAAVQSHDSALRVAALRALGQRGGDEVTETLQWVAATEADAEVAQAAIDALAQVATPEAIDALVALTSDQRLREACITALARFDETQLEWIARGLTHVNVEVRRAVTEALGRIKRSNASDLLSAALDDPEAAVRLAAANALGYLGNRRAERKLVALARTDPEMAVRRAAEKALGK